MSTMLIARRCPNCGAPRQDEVVCAYCDSQLAEAPVRPQARTRPEILPQGLFTVEVGDTPYCVLGQLAQGENARVLLARRAQAATEQVVLKVAEPGKAEVLEREWATLRHLHGRSDYLDCLLAHPLQLAQARGRLTLVTRWRSGFVYTAAQARQQYSEGVDPAATVWMWNRILDQLSCLDELGYSHNDLRPEHLLLHPRDHGVAFCGWGRAELGPGNDLARSGQCIAALLGRKAPRALVQLAHDAHHFDCPRQLRAALKDVAAAAFGPPRYRPFALPRVNKP
ncbi:MAG: zinc ribbon domain-containing protein [Vulcanimicrobiota bacterium]